MNIAQFLHLTAPSNPSISGIPHGAAQILERAANDIYALLTVAHQEVKAIHQPDDLRGQLIEWEGHAPLQLEVREDRLCKIHLIDIRVRGASVSEHLMTGLWDSAEQWLQERHTSHSPATVERAAGMDRADQNLEKAA